MTTGVLARVIYRIDSATKFQNNKSLSGQERYGQSCIRHYVYFQGVETPFLQWCVEYMVQNRMHVSVVCTACPLYEEAELSCLRL